MRLEQNLPAVEYRCVKCGLFRCSDSGGEYKRTDGTIGYVNDGGDKCTDCLIADPQWPVGMRVVVKAWWNSGKTVLCEVRSKAESSEHLTVQPLEGNPHMRFVSIADVVTEM